MPEASKPSTEKSAQHKGVKTASTLTGRDAVNQPAPRLATRKLPSGSLQDYQILLLFHPTTLQPSCLLRMKSLSFSTRDCCLFFTQGYVLLPSFFPSTHTHTSTLLFLSSPNPRNQFNFTLYMFPT